MAKYTITNRYRVIEVGALEMPYLETDEHGYICVDCGMEVGMAYFLAHDKAEAISRIGTEDGEVCASWEGQPLIGCGCTRTAWGSGMAQARAPYKYI